jgi:E3 ubiquitin-protein ligase UBR1
MAAEEMTTQEAQLCEFLRDLPRRFKHRYTESASKDLLYSLFWSLAGGREEHMRLFFPEGKRPTTGTWKLREAQGAVDGAEYTEAARGKACGHIFKSGEATYRCKTCSADDTCVLCSRCYDSSDHTGHMVYIQISPGNSGCCDCGDPEAWRLPIHCSIHTERGHEFKKEGKTREAASLPDELVESIRMTIGRAFDYICDVISCSPEQLRVPKTVENITADERMSRLTSSYYKGDIIEEPMEYALLLWNDEKHTVNEVRDQVARACKLRMPEALARAHETDDVGRSIVKYDTDLESLLDVSRIIEQIKVTVTIRSARDTFREQMCGTIIEWLGDIAGCSVGHDHNILRQVVCEEMLKEWRMGSEASNAEIGKNGLDDQELDDRLHGRENMFIRQAQLLRAAAFAAERGSDDESHDSDPDDGNGEDGQDDPDRMADDAELEAVMDVIMGDTHLETDTDGDVDMTEDPALPVREATLDPPPPPLPPPRAPLPLPETPTARFSPAPPPPPPPPPAPQRVMRDRDLTPSDSDTAEPLISHTVYAKVNIEIPKTAGVVAPTSKANPARYWLETPASFKNRDAVPLHEDLFQRVRLDWMILFDLRMWKKVRVDLRDLYISTVVTIPQFKRVLGLRFAGLYTLLAQLYLIADREPDHSIINISLQMLTTPSITSEIVERGNFLTNLMAILYTFLTTRQVAPPHDIRPNGTLDFQAGSVTNRRMYHFFMDLRYLFSSEHVQEKLRTDYRYMLQFLDLAKLLQGVCPNVRAVGEHVEYETDAWISASLITREINRLCRQFSESFKWKKGEDMTSISFAIRMAAKAVILSSLGTERKRFNQAEIKEEIKFKKVKDYEFDTTDSTEHSVVKFSVDTQPISFHHALHYTLSWLIECGKSMSRDELVQLLTFTTEDLMQKPKAMGQRVMPSRQYGSEDHLMAAFDYPLRVCAWLAQMKASMWVRNGMSLRHQAGTYRGVTQRDVCHHRDIFLLQTAMVVCPPSRVLASIVDRYGLEMWMKGIYEQKADELDDGQQLDVVEDLIHLLIVLLSDRTSLIAVEDEPNPHMWAMRRDITHVLCFKPLSFSEICSKLPDKFQEQEECQDILDEMTTFKPPEGLQDVGTFELKPQFFEDIDPYIAHYNKNQREEAENAYRARMAKKTGRPESDIVFESKLRLIESGAFVELAAFTKTGIFAQIIYYALLYPLKASELTPNVPATRVETFLQVVLHLVLIAISEDKADEDEMSEDSLQSFVYIALTRNARSNFMNDFPQAKTIVALLEMMSSRETFKACHSKVALVLKRMKQKRPQNFEIAFTRLGVSVDRISTASPANSNADEDKGKKKQMALARQAKVMAQFQQQQKSFLDNQGEIDWGEDETSDEDMASEAEEHKNYWKYPSGTCILCQEETSDTKPYGTFAMLTQSRILRQTDFTDPDFLREVANTPINLDHSAEAIRPFGVAGENREQVVKTTYDGNQIVTERQVIGKGFPSHLARPGPVSVGCGHIMHYKCFELYYEASQRRHSHQIARHHPETLELNEFVCPLCKALGNAFLPIIWRGKEEVYPGVLQPNIPYDHWLDNVIAPSVKRLQKSAEPGSHGSFADSHFQELFVKYVRENVMPPLASKISQLHTDAWTVPASTPAVVHSSRTQPVNTPGLLPGLSAEITVAASHPWETTDVAMQELVRVYLRLSETMKKNSLPIRYPRDQMEQKEICGTSTLAKTLGFSISAIEILQRGVESQLGSTFLDKVPQQYLTHLRILAETTVSYVAIGGLKNGGDNKAAKDFSRTFDRQVAELFIGHPQMFRISSFDPIGNEALLNSDPFVFLTECSICLANVLDIDILHIVRLCYTAEIVKVILAMGHNMPAATWLSWIGLLPGVPNDGQYPEFRLACATITQNDMMYHHLKGDDQPNSEPSKGFDQPWMKDIAACHSFVQKYALVFLRKCVLLLYIRYGTDFNSHISHNPSDSELDRLTEALRLPSFDSIGTSLCNGDPQGRGDPNPSMTSRLVEGWMQHQAMSRCLRSSSTEILYPGGENPYRAPDIELAHPAIFELIGLPKNYDTLMEETMRRRCPTTGKDVTDPMLCLFCGDIFCGQSICCLKEEGGTRNKPASQIGGAQQHMRK